MELLEKERDALFNAMGRDVAKIICSFVYTRYYEILTGNFKNISVSYLLFFAIDRDYFEIIEYQLDVIDPQDRDEYAVSIMRQAACWDNFITVKRLLKKGYPWDPFIFQTFKRLRNYLALHWFCQNRYHNNYFWNTRFDVDSYMKISSDSILPRKYPNQERKLIENVVKKHFGPPI